MDTTLPTVSELTLMKRNMTKLPENEVGILLYEGASLAAVHGLEEMFTFAHINRSSDSIGSLKTVRIEEPLLAPEIIPSEPVSDLYSIIVIPPTTANVTGSAKSETLSWIREQYARGVVISSACGGTCILAETGLLDGRVATTHWSLAEEVAARFRSINFDTQELLIDDGDIITAGGVTAWMQLGLRIIERYLGTDTMIGTAKFMLIDPGPRPQSYYASFATKLDHNDLSILKAQRWLLDNPGETFTLDSLAAHAALTTRTFIRRFQRVTGMNPTEYGQRLRVSRSQMLLERSRKTIEEISWECGYEDHSAYRRVFKRYIGVTPGEYRTRLSLYARSDLPSDTVWPE